jgi:hypothetical protein
VGRLCLCRRHSNSKSLRSYQRDSGGVRLQRAGDSMTLNRLQNRFLRTTSMKLWLFGWMWLVLMGGTDLAQSITKKTVCSSGCDYANTFTGFNQALIDAAGSQNATCAPYLIEVAAGQTVDAGSNFWTLPAKNCRQYITIRSSRMDSLPPDGVRIDPAAHGAFLAQLRGSGNGSTIITGPTNSYTAYWRFEGIDFNVVGGNNNTPFFYAVLWGETGSTFPSSVDRTLRPDHLEIKHCWIHGVPGSRNLLNGVGIGGNSVRILDSYFDAIAADGTEAHAVLVGFSDGPVEVRNSRLASSTETILVGGVLMSAGTIPSFLSFVGNTMAKDPYNKFASGGANPTWACRQGYVYRNTSTNHDWICNAANTWADQGGLTNNGPTVVKNIWECKICRGVRIYGNEFTGMWFPAAQDPSLITLNLTTQPAGSLVPWIQPSTEAQPWTTIEDVEISANRMYNAQAILILAFPGGIGSVCSVNPAPPCYSYGHNHIRLHDNLAYNLGDERDYANGDAQGGGIGFASFNSGTFDVSMYHNTLLTSTWSPASGEYYRFGAAPSDATIGGQITVRDNITPIGAHGLISTGGLVTFGVCSLVGSLNAAGGYDARTNIFTRDKSAWVTFSAGPVQCVNGSDLWPTGNRSAANGGTVVNETTPTYKVLSAYQGSASDGRDPGANVDLVNWATAGALSGALNPFLNMQIRSTVAQSTSATIYFTAPSVNACTVEASPNRNYIPAAGTAALTQTGQDVKGQVSGLTANTYYFFRTTCDGYQLESGFRTAP